MSAKMILRTACGLVITLAILMLVVSTVQAEAPANDNFADAKLISDSPYEDSLETYEATTELDEPIPDCWGGWSYPGDIDSHTVWYVLTPTSNGYVQGYVDRDFPAGMTVYSGSDLANLTEIGCWRYVSEYGFTVESGVTYYLQIGGIDGYAGWIHLSLEIYTPPPNDNFADASLISLGQTISINNYAASLEMGEPRPCGDTIKTVWFVFTPTTNGSVTADPSEWWNFVAAYTGSDLQNLTLINCREYGDPLPISVEAGTTYYFQVGSTYEWWGYGAFNFQLYETPPPAADFGWGPGDPNIFDTVEFCDWSSDPVNMGFTEFWWDFGGGVTTTGNCAYHRYSADGDYTVWHNIQTSDGRTDPDGVIHEVSVRTHDVAAVRVAAPKSASVGQTRQITVYIKNNRYPERVQIELFKSIPGGFESVGITSQNIPVRGGNRTTAVSFSYTFAQGDADIGKVTFKAVVNLIDARDALPGDNEAISPPTKVQ